MLEAEAKERQKKHGGTAPGRGKETLPTELKEVFSPPKLEAAAQAAELVGASATRVYEIKRVVKEALDRIEAIRNGEVSIDKVLKETSFDIPEKNFIMGTPKELR